MRFCPIRTVCAAVAVDSFLCAALSLPSSSSSCSSTSSYLPNPDGVAPTPASLATPILFLHGDADQVVPLDYGKDGVERVKAVGFSDVTMKVRVGDDGVQESATSLRLIWMCIVVVRLPRRWGKQCFIFHNVFSLVSLPHTLLPSSGVPRPAPRGQRGGGEGCCHVVEATAATGKGGRAGGS